MELFKWVWSSAYFLFSDLRSLDFTEVQIYRAAPGCGPGRVTLVLRVEIKLQTTHILRFLTGSHDAQHHVVCGRSI